MASTLVFPDSIRLARGEDLPGRGREAAVARIEAANITPGFVLVESDDSRFSHYAEANIDAPLVWTVFCDLCRGLLGPVTQLVISEIDDEAVEHFGPARTLSILEFLEQHSYQLANDGLIQFGLIEQRDDSVAEVFVAPTKHFEVWLSNEKVFRTIMKNHGLRQADKLEFIDDYPRVTIPLLQDKIRFPDHSELIEHFKKQVGDLPLALNA